MKKIKTRTRYAFVGSDYSQQEPRILTAITQDPTLMEAYTEGKDMYAMLGTRVFNNDYWDNMEHYQDGTKNEEGAKRRKKMKVLYLGITYGMGPTKLSESLGCSREEAEGFINGFFDGFPKVKVWMDNLKKEAKKKGYVEDFFGRRRHLPDLLLPELTFSSEEDNKFNPLLFTTTTKKEVEPDVIRLWTDKFRSAKTRTDRDNVIAAAKKRGIVITQNGGFIAEAERQCVNAAIQGSAASMTKKAMNMLRSDERLIKLGYRMRITVHDEIIGECPEENSEEVATLVENIMKSAAKEIPVPFKCDAEIENHWYENTYAASLQKEYNNYIKSGLSEEVAFQKVKLDHIESTEEEIKEYLAKEV